VTENELNALLKQWTEKVIPPFTVGVSAETRDETKRSLKQTQQPGLKEIPIRTIGNDYILIDLAGVDLNTARDLASKPGKFEIRIQVKGNETEHVLYGTDITPGLPEKKKEMFGVYHLP